MLGGHQMDIKTVKLVCFSPTGTTKAVVKSIARGINHANVELIDITKPIDRELTLVTGNDELLIMAIPVYMGRVPSVISDWLNSIKANNTHTVCVVVYGNRAFDDALLELKDILVNCGCTPIAGAAFIGEHSFSSADLPSSVGRPDTNDLQLAQMFGHKIVETIKTASSVNIINNIELPGNFPYGGTKNLWHLDFIKVNDNCMHCGICATVCPVGAIEAENSGIMDIDKCTLCCACIKNCPQNARTMKPGPMRDAAIRCTNFIERKEPEYFFTPKQVS
jgi:ferredoxin